MTTRGLVRLLWIVAGLIWGGVFCIIYAMLSLLNRAVR